VTLVEDFGTSLEGSVYRMNLAYQVFVWLRASVMTLDPFESYTKYLANNGKSLDYVVTQLSFNEDNDNQSILFTPVRFITEDQVRSAGQAKSPPYLNT
jgi:hypothetical protein